MYLLRHYKALLNTISMCFEILIRNVFPCKTLFYFTIEQHVF